MRKVVLVPLDERPCNTRFPTMLAAMTDWQLVTPEGSLLGQKKVPAKVESLVDWAEKEAQTATGMIVAMDMWLYGGIVPSRLHHIQLDDLRKRLASLAELKRQRPNLILYAYSLIMRNPTYSSDDEEPDYYATWGRDIHLKGKYEHQQKLGLLSEAGATELETIQARLPDAYFKDYITRRAINRHMNEAIIDLVVEGIIDFLIIPQDDASPYGLTAMDQALVRNHIDAHHVGHKVYMYPGADETANTLLSRMIHSVQGEQPKVHPTYTSEQAKYLIPLYEDRPLHETVKYHIIASGGVLAEGIADADILWVIHAPPSRQLNASQADQRSIEYDAFINLPAALETIRYALDVRKLPVVVGDVAYGNGADLRLIAMLRQAGLLFRLAGYAGWNTSSNSLGTCLPQGMLYRLYGPSLAHQRFLGHRYAEDAGYCASVRQTVIQTVLPKMGLHYFLVDAPKGEVAAIVHTQLQQWLDKNINDAQYQIKITQCVLPWQRMFEVGLKVEVHAYEVP